MLNCWNNGVSVVLFVCLCACLYVCPCVCVIVCLNVCVCLFAYVNRMLVGWLLDLSFVRSRMCGCVFVYLCVWLFV